MINGILDSNQKIVSNGLVLNLDAAQKRSYPGSGTTWTDLSGNANNGTLTNGPTFDSANGGSISFDGTNDFVSNASRSVTAFPFTINVFAKTSNTSSTFRDFFSITNTSNDQEFINIQLTSTQKLAFAVRTVNFTQQNTATTLDSYNDGLWHMFTGVAVTYGNLSIYVDGVFEASSTTTNYSFPNTNTQTISGLRRTTTSNYFPGNISSIQVYNRALSATEILQNYNAVKSRFGL
jgi:hypothetical protein